MIFNGGYPFSILLSFIIFFAMTVYSFRFRRSQESFYIIILMALMSFQALASMFELIAGNLEDKLHWRNVQQIPLYYSAALLLCMIMSFIGIRFRIIVRWLVILSCIMLLYWILLFTDSQHHLIRVSVSLEAYGGAERIQMERTHLGLMFLTFNNLLGLSGLSLLLINLRKVSGIYKMQHILLIMAIVSPYAFTYMCSLIGWKISVAVSMIPTSFLLFYSFFMYKFLQVRPLAKEKVLEHMAEGIVIIDDQDYIIDANPAALPIIERVWGKIKLEGAYLPPLLEDYPKLRAFYELKEQGAVEVENAGRQYEVRLIPIQVRHKRTSTLLIFTEITERKDYEKQLIQRATMDDMTQLYNRKHFLECLELIMEQCRKVGEPICLLLLDLDDFKMINDKFGHLVGDRVLMHFAALLREATGETGLAGRVGGEEFALALPGATDRVAFEVAEQLRLRVEQEPLRYAEAGAVEVSFTISIGAVELLDPNMTLEAWYQQADNYLYNSKHSGKNRTTLAK